MIYFIQSYSIGGGLCYDLTKLKLKGKQPATTALLASSMYVCMYDTDNIVLLGGYSYR